MKAFFQFLRSSQPKLFVLTICLFTACSLSLHGCAGGTDGTGLKNIDAKLLNVDGEPIAGAVITVVETGDSGVTDSEGTVQFDTKTDDSVLHFLVESSSLASQVAVEDVPTGNISVRLSFSVQEDNSVKLDDIVTEKPKPTPSPARTASPTKAPTAAPTVAPTAAPSAEPSAEPSAIPSPTVTPSRAPTPHPSSVPFPD